MGAHSFPFRTAATHRSDNCHGILLGICGPRNDNEGKSAQTHGFPVRCAESSPAFGIGASRVPHIHRSSLSIVSASSGFPFRAASISLTAFRISLCVGMSSCRANESRGPLVCSTHPYSEKCHQSHCLSSIPDPLGAVDEEGGVESMENTAASLA